MYLLPLVEIVRGEETSEGQDMLQSRMRQGREAWGSPSYREDAVIKRYHAGWIPR